MKISLFNRTRKNVKINASELLADNLTVAVTIGGIRRAMWRVRLAQAFLRLAARVAPFKLELRRED